LLAQPAGPLRLVGVLMGFGEGDRQSRALIAEFRAALANLGWKEGSNLRTELRWGAGDVARIADFAKELVALKPDALLGQTTPVAVSLARETKSIPIIFVTVSDPIGSGLAASLAHPGGNVTGFTFVESTVGGKWVQLHHSSSTCRGSKRPHHHSPSRRVQPQFTRKWRSKALLLPPHAIRGAP
jgi:putative ABC transport system substrate-binding protein